jgi:hypothetical protein
MTKQEKIQDGFKAEWASGKPFCFDCKKQFREIHVYFVNGRPRPVCGRCLKNYDTSKL